METMNDSDEYEIEVKNNGIIVTLIDIKSMSDSEENEIDLENNAI